MGKSKVNLVDGCLQAMLLLLVAITPHIEFTNAIEDFHQGQACFKPSAYGEFLASLKGKLVTKPLNLHMKKKHHVSGATAQRSLQELLW